MLQEQITDLVKPEIYFRLKTALENKRSPLLLVGPGGSGKSTILSLLYHDWKAVGAPVFWLSLFEIYREDDLVSALRTKLNIEKSKLTFNQPIVVGSSGSGALTLIVKEIGSLKGTPLILLDGLDETRDLNSILRFIRMVSSTDCLVLAAGRSVINDSRTFDAIYRTEGFSADEFAELIQRQDPQLILKPTELDQLYSAAQGSPLLATILARDFRRHRELFGNKPFVKEELLDIHLKAAIDELKSNAPLALATLVILALRGPTSPLELERLGLSVPDESTGLIHRQPDSVALSHLSFVSPILRLAGILPSPGTKLDDLKFGAEEAERDRLLVGTFIELSGYANLAKGEKNIVIGDRGTGKSALFAQLGTPASSATEQSRVISIKVTHPKEMLNKLEANGSELRTAEQFRAGWLTLAAYALADQRSLLPLSERKIATRLRKALVDEDEPTNPFIRTLKEMWKWRAAVKIKIGPVQIEPTGTSRKNGITIDVLAFIKSAAKGLSRSERTAIIAVDRVDEIHKYDRNLQEKAVQGLFLAEGDLAQIPNIGFLIFLRSDLFNIYDIQEKNKLVSRTLTIVWTKGDLLEFLIDRVLANDAFSGLKTFIGELPAIKTAVATSAILPERIEDLGAVDWLWECLENGNGDVSPRQIILLLLLAAQSPVAKGLIVGAMPIFPASALQWAMNRLSELSFQELVDDFRVAPTFLANCKAGKLETFHPDNVRDLFGENEGSISLQINLLERLGFLERVVIRHTNGEQSTLFKIPKLFRRAWAGN